MFLRLFPQSLQSNVYFMLTFASLKSTIIDNIPAKPMKFVFSNLMLKLCGFSFSSALKQNSNHDLINANAYLFDYVHLVKAQGERL